MKKPALILLACILLAAGCTPANQLSDAEMATMVAQALTQFPTNTATEPPAAPPTALPTATAEPSATPTAEPSNTPLPSETPVILPGDTPAAGATPESPPLPTSTYAPDDPLTRLGPATSVDPMENSANWVWPTTNSTFSTIEFKDGAMWIKSLGTDAAWQLSAAREMTDFYLEMVARLESCSKTDSYGMMVRVPVLYEANRGYLYGLTCDGQYYLKIWDGLVAPKGKMTSLVSNTSHPAIQPGGLQFNRIGLMAVGNNLRLYANGVLLQEIQDSTFPKGYAGVFINQDFTPGLTMRVDMMSYWENPAP